MKLRFEWDRSKAHHNQRKHGVSFEEAATAFADPLARIFPDGDHSEFERREILVGRTIAGRLILTAFVERREGTVRIISARSTTRREQRDYEQNVKA